MTLHVETLYWLPYCSSCVKAKDFLEAQGLSVNNTHDIKADPLSAELIKKLAEGVGGVEALFSKRAMKYRAMGLHEKTVTEDEMLKLMQEEYTFIKRPVVVLNNGKTVCGFSKKQYEALTA